MILPLITPSAHELMYELMLSRVLYIIITDSNRVGTAHIAQALGVNNLIAAESGQKNGEFTGRVSRRPCFREGKITKLENWLDERNLTWLSFLESWFYSDSLNDMPLLNKVSRPVAVDPDTTLKSYAEENNWPIISLR